MLQIFTVRDNYAQECGQVFSCKNELLAVEEIKTLFRNGVKCGYTDNPSRYSLMHLAMFDSDRATITPAKSRVVKTFVEIKESYMQDVMSDKNLSRVPIVVDNEESQENKYTLPPSPAGDEANVEVVA